jgi:apolipoprotein N-acyltransferase
VARIRAPRAGGALLLALLWCAMEWAQSDLFSGFGWSALGYTQGPDTAVAQCASLGGVSIISFFLVFVNALLALACMERKNRLPRAGLAVLMLFAAHGGILFSGAADYAKKPLTVGIFQSNFPQEMKWDWEYTEDMVRKAATQSALLAKEEKVDGFVWPEALVMRHYEDADLMTPMTELTQTTGAWLFTGTVRDVRQESVFRSFNSSVLILPDGKAAGYYDKVHLAPFGEYMPFASCLPFLRHITPNDVDPGNVQKVFDTGKFRFGPLICFEVLFDHLSEHLRAQGAEFLTVVTNLGWFGQSNAVMQELEIARFRAIETRLPLVQSSNTGISGVFDPWGKFRTIDGMVAADGQYRHFRDGLDPSMLLMQRCVGAVPVSAPAKRFVPFTPYYVSHALGALGLLWACAACFFARRRGPKVEVLPPANAPRRGNRARV